MNGTIVRIRCKIDVCVVLHDWCFFIIAIIHFLIKILLFVSKLIFVLLLFVTVCTFLGFHAQLHVYTAKNAQPVLA